MSRRSAALTFEFRMRDDDFSPTLSKNSSVVKKNKKETLFTTKTEKKLSFLIARAFFLRLRV
jgi:hypothetical protein